MERWVDLITLSAVGILLIVFGLLIWLRQKVGLLHSYHYCNIRPADLPAYSKRMGISLVIFGVCSVLTGVINAVTRTQYGWIAFVIGLIVFLIIANRAQQKYNGGWFG